MLDGGEYSDLIQCVLLLSVREMTDFHLLQGVLTAILDSLDLIHTRIRSIPYEKDKWRYGSYLISEGSESHLRTLLI
jgi:hypothetical protein